MKEWLGVSQKSFYQNANGSFTIPKIVIVSTSFVDVVKHIFEKLQFGQKGQKC